MDTPLRRAAEEYLAKNRARFHMPGHKGTDLPPFGYISRYDLTEIPGLDSLYEASGPIAETEARYAKLYEASGTLLSAGGATLCIQTMLTLALRPGDTVLCARGVHTAAVNTMALLDLRPAWFIPETDDTTGLAGAVNAMQVEAALAEHPDAAAVYLTSPDYFGVLCNIAAISAVCKRRGVPLLVDNAHGAHLKFLTPDRHPITLGADLCCDSPHKTLPVLTGGALLHIGNPRFLADARRKMGLFGSTSPSYLILLSLDAALPWLEGRAPDDLAAVAARVRDLESFALAGGFLIPSDVRDPLHFSIGFEPLGYTAETFRAHLARYGVEPEYISGDFCVFLAGVRNTAEDFALLRDMLETAGRTQSARGASPIRERRADVQELPKQVLTVREAALAPSETIPASKAAGRVCAGTVTPCPPGIPLAVPGELLDEKFCAICLAGGISHVNVVKY